MFEKNYIDNIEDMLQACEDIDKTVQGVSLKEFETDMFRYRTAERLFEILGEAANRIPKYLQEKHRDIQWKNIIGMRNIIIHCYEKVDVSTLWGAGKNDLPILRQALKKMLLDLDEK